MNNKKIKAELLKDFQIIKSLEQQYTNIAELSTFLVDNKENIDKLYKYLKALEESELIFQDNELDEINDESSDNNPEIKSGKALKKAFTDWSTKQIASLEKYSRNVLDIEYNEIILLLNKSIKGTSNILLKNIYTDIKNILKNESQNIGMLCLAITDVLDKYNNKKGFFFFNYYIKNFKSYRKDSDSAFYNSLAEFMLIEMIETLINQKQKDDINEKEASKNELTALLNKTMLEQNQSLLKQLQGYIDGKFTDLENLSIEHLTILKDILQTQSMELKAIGINTKALQQKIDIINTKVTNINANVSNVQKSLDNKFPEAAGKIIFDDKLNQSSVPLSLALVYKYEEDKGIKVPIIYNGEAYGSPSIANMTFKEYSIMNIGAAKVDIKNFTVTHEIDVRCHVIKTVIEDHIIDEELDKQLQEDKKVLAASKAVGGLSPAVFIFSLLGEVGSVYNEKAIEDNKITRPEVKDTLFFMKYVAFISFDPKDKKGATITFTRILCTNEKGEEMPEQIDKMLFKGNTDTLLLK